MLDGVMREKSLSDIAYAKIKEKLMRGDFSEQNNYTSQNQLVDELQMSRTPIIGALQRLQYEGFVKIISNQGIVIQDITVKEMIDFFDARLAIELFSIKKAISMMTEDDFCNLKAIIERQKENYKDYFAWVQLDADFHQYLLEIPGNSVFIHMMNNVSERLFFSVSTRLKNNDRIQRFTDEHIQIIEHLRQGDLAQVLQVLEYHIESGKIALI
ncbi:MAG TPA: GntR family transcriptional regulator [Ktedonobacteraceae bacterium]